MAMLLSPSALAKNDWSIPLAICYNKKPIIVGNKLQDTTTKTETCKMVHCDFGWEGRCNGYYVSGVFKLNDSNIEHDPGSNYGGNTYYNNLLKVITYDKP